MPRTRTRRHTGKKPRKTTHTRKRPVMTGGTESKGIWQSFKSAVGIKPKSNKPVTKPNEQIKNPSDYWAKMSNADLREMGQKNPVIKEEIIKFMQERQIKNTQPELPVSVSQSAQKPEPSYGEPYAKPFYGALFPPEKAKSFNGDPNTTRSRLGTYETVNAVRPGLGTYSSISNTGEQTGPGLEGDYASANNVMPTSSGSPNPTGMSTTSSAPSKSPVQSIDPNAIYASVNKNRSKSKTISETNTPEEEVNNANIGPGGKPLSMRNNTGSRQAPALPARTYKLPFTLNNKPTPGGLNSSETSVPRHSEAQPEGWAYNRVSTVLSAQQIANNQKLYNEVKKSAISQIKISRKARADMPEIIYKKLDELVQAGKLDRGKINSAASALFSKLKNNKEIPSYFKYTRFFKKDEQKEKNDFALDAAKTNYEFFQKQKAREASLGRAANEEEEEESDV